MTPARLWTGSRFSSFCILLWLSFLIQSLEGGLSTPRPSSSVVFPPKSDISESAQGLASTLKLKRTQSLFAIVKHYHDQLLQMERYKDFELQQILLAPMSPLGSPGDHADTLSLSSEHQVVQLSFVNRVSLRFVPVSIFFEDMQMEGTEMPSEDFDASSTVSAYTKKSLRLEPHQPETSLAALKVPLDIPDGFWNMKLVDFLGIIAESSGRSLPILHHNNKKIGPDHLDIVRVFYVHRSPRACTNLQWRVSDPTPSTLDIFISGDGVITGVLGTSNGRLHLTEITFSEVGREPYQVVRRWPLWLRRRQGIIPAWHGEIIKDPQVHH